MSRNDVDELLTDLFPQKITLIEPEEADFGLPAMIAFWEFLKREFQLENADEILDYLRSVKPEKFRSWMNDSSRFGIGKLFMMIGQSSGFDMTNPDDVDLFNHLYNSNLPLLNPRNYVQPPPGTVVKSNIDREKAKRKRKIARASRKK